MRKTKIICTLGPSSSTYEQIKAMALAGMNVARINMSHGTHSEHQAKIDTVKKVRRSLGMPIPIMIDTKGPEVRICTFENGSVEIVEGQKFDFVCEDIVGDNTKVGVTYKDLYKDIVVGGKLLGAKVFLTEPLGPETDFFIKIKRKFEKFISVCIGYCIKPST